MRPARKVLYAAAAVSLVLLVLLPLADALVAVVLRPPSLTPPRQLDRRYGLVSPANARMVHQRAGSWRFVYTTNRLGHRGKELPTPAADGRPAVLLLGDSNTFGYGVNDDDVYSAVMARDLGGRARVINLAMGGWGLGQAIRRYQEVGRACHPRVVVLQFYSNDLGETYLQRVTTLERGRFVFHDLPAGVVAARQGPLVRLLQRSTLYTLLREGIYQTLKRRFLVSLEERLRRDQGLNLQQAKERFYAELLTAFSQAVRHDGARLVFIAVQGSLKRAPLVRQRVLALHREGALRYIDTRELFTLEPRHRSPEGHSWGAPAHHAIGAGLAARLVRDGLL